MQPVIEKLAQLLAQSKTQRTHLPSLRPVCLVEVNGAGSITVNLQSNVVSAAAVADPDCTIHFSSESILEEVLANPSKAWIYSGRGGDIKVSDNLSAAILLESLFPGTLAATLTPRQFYALFPHLIPNEYAGSSTENFFDVIIPQKIAANSHLLNTVNAAFQFDIEGAGTWTIDVTTAPGEVYAGPAKSKGSVISTDRKVFEEVLNDDAKAWEYFNAGKIVVSNACRASQVVNAFWPTAFAKGMPGSLHASLFPNEAGDPSAPEYNKTTGDYITYIQGEDGPVPIHYGQLGDLAIFEGDIILGTITAVEQVRQHVEGQALLPEGVRIINWGNPSYYMWPGGVVCYKRDASLTNEAAKELGKAMDHWTSKTNITFKERTTETDYVIVKDSTGCSSYVGRRGGEQALMLNKQCDFGAVVHEIGHAIGLFHEQSRIDRDTYVTIKWDQIIEDMKHNFDKVNSGYAQDLGAYDYGSIMHYGANAFAKGKEPTIVTIPAGIAIGQRNGLSDEDVQSVAAIYGAK
jgi:Astacin (Peptidase family M12A)/SCP-2 sterol transfer family